MRKKLGRNELARQVHFRKAGPTDKTGRRRRKAQRQRDHLDERKAIQERDSGDEE